MFNYQSFPALLFILILFNSCEGIVQGEGRIVSSADYKPIEGVEVKWINSDEKVYTDAGGHFKVGAFCGCVPECPKLEVSFYKKGYQTIYLDLQKEFGYNTDSLTIKMTPGFSKELEEGSLSNLFQALNIAISILNVVTLIYILYYRQRFKFVWILLLLFFSLRVNYNYFNGSTEYNFFNFFIYSSNKFGWYSVHLPFVVILYWTERFLRKRDFNEKYGEITA